MSVTSVEKDFDSLTLTLIADFRAPLEQVWQLWADPGSWSGGGDRRPTRRPWSSTIWSRVAPSPTS